MQYSQEHLKTMVYAKFGGQTECIMGNSKIENTKLTNQRLNSVSVTLCHTLIHIIKNENRSKKIAVQAFLKLGL